MKNCRFFFSKKIISKRSECFPFALDCDLHVFSGPQQEEEETNAVTCEVPPGGESSGSDEADGDPR